LIHHGAGENQTIQAIRPQFARELREVGHMNDARPRAGLNQRIFGTVKRRVNNRHREQRSVQRQRRNRDVTAG
jgi:hypothetical protein